MSQLGRHVIAVGIGGARTDFVQQTLFQQFPEITLEGPPVDVGEQTFEVTEGEPARREQLGQQGRLAAVQPIRAANNISPDGGGASRLDLLQLGGQPADEVL